jgi:glutamine synthetase
VEHAERLRNHGLRLLCGVVADCGGVVRTKAVPAARMEIFGSAGVGISPTWSVFCVDNAIAMTDDLNVVGDLRLTADLSRAVVLDHGFGWAPADVRMQDGSRSPLCWRDVARRQAARLADRGITVRAGFELEFVVMDEPDQHPDHRFGDDGTWAAYGLAPVSRAADFVTTAVQRLAEAGIQAWQVHAEYGGGQFEISLPPGAPLAAADTALLARTVLGRVARELGWRLSFSPMPFAGGTGNGAHLHLSFDIDGRPLLSGGPGPAGLTPEGESLLAGLLDGLPESIAVLAGSVVSADRLSPDNWAGPFRCWGVENREAAIRLVQATAGNPYGAHAEVRCLDHSANPYLAMGVVLGLAMDGLEAKRELPEAVEVNPSRLTDAEATRLGVERLPASAVSALEAFEEGRRVRAVLGPELTEALVSVRRHESTAFADPSVDPCTATRFAWST